MTKRGSAFWRMHTGCAQRSRTAAQYAHAPGRTDRASLGCWCACRQSAPPQSAAMTAHTPPCRCEEGYCSVTCSVALVCGRKACNACYMAVSSLVGAANAMRSSDHPNHFKHRPSQAGAMPEHGSPAAVRRGRQQLTSPLLGAADRQKHTSVWQSRSTTLARGEKAASPGGCSQAA